MASANAFTASSHKVVPNASSGKKHEIIHHCAINPGTTEFALLNDEGNFFKLDETGNLAVLLRLSQSETGPGTSVKELRVSLTGSIDRETVNVNSLQDVKF